MKALKTWAAPQENPKAPWSELDSVEQAPDLRVSLIITKCCEVLL